MTETKRTPAEIVFPEAGIHQLVPECAPRLLAYELGKFLKRKQTTEATEYWSGRVEHLRMALRSHGVGRSVEDAAVKTMTDATRAALAADRAKRAAKPSAQVIPLRPRAAGGGQ